MTFMILADLTSVPGGLVVYMIMTTLIAGWKSM